METVFDMANTDLKYVDAVNLARITPHQLDVVSESILCAMLSLENVLVNKHRDFRDYIKDNKIEFQQAWIDTCGARQAPAI